MENRSDGYLKTFRMDINRIRINLIKSIISDLLIMTIWIAIVMIWKLNYLAIIVGLVIITFLEIVTYVMETNRIKTTVVGINSTQLVISYGNCIKKETTVFLNKIYSIEKKEGLFSKYFNLNDVGIRTVEKYFELKGISSNSAEQIIKIIEEHI